MVFAGAPSLVRTTRTRAELEVTNCTTVMVGVGSFFLMPQSPARTKSWWNPKGYFNEKEEKIIVNSGRLSRHVNSASRPPVSNSFLAQVIRDDPQKGGMYNRQGLSVRQIWECSKDYDMWPLYALGLLFGLPKYPVGVVFSNESSFCRSPALSLSSQRSEGRVSSLM